MTFTKPTEEEIRERINALEKEMQDQHKWLAMTEVLESQYRNQINVLKWVLGEEAEDPIYPM